MSAGRQLAGGKVQEGDSEWGNRDDLQRKRPNSLASDCVFHQARSSEVRLADACALANLRFHYGLRFYTRNCGRHSIRSNTMQGWSHSMRSAVMKRPVFSPVIEMGGR